VETAPVTVVEEAELSNNTRRHSAQEAHSPRAPPRQEPEKPAAVEAPDGVEHLHWLGVACRWWRGRTWRSRRHRDGGGRSRRR
jgi:hypothetical protein